MPLSEILVVFHELIKLPRLLACQQKVPAPSKVKGAEIVDVTGLQVEPVPGVFVRVGEMMGVGDLVTVNGVGVRVGVFPEPGVAVRVCVAVRATVAVAVAQHPLVMGAPNTGQSLG